MLILAGVTIATLTGDNGILTQAGNAKTSNKEGETSEQFALLANEWVIEKNTKNKTLGEFLNGKMTEGKLSSIEDNGNGTYTIKLNGYQTIIDQDGKTSSMFNPEEWDKTACKESSFLWESDDPNSGEAYHKIIGYADSITNETKLKIPSRCHEIRSDVGNWNTVGRTFSANNFTNIEFPETIEIIGDNAFSGFISLTKVTIPNGVTVIDTSAFCGCTSLTSVTIPDSVTNISISAFRNCTSLINIIISDNYAPIIWGGGGEWSAFANTAWWNSQPNEELVYIGKTVYGYKGTMPNNTAIEIKEGTKSIGSNAFDSCTGLTSITIPNSVTSIGFNTFAGCSSLSGITIPKSITTISGWAFNRWTSSQTINIQGYSNAPSGWSSYWNDGCSAQINWNQ